MTYEQQKAIWRRKRARILAMLQKKPHSEVAKAFGISRQRVYRIEKVYGNRA